MTGQFVSDRAFISTRGKQTSRAGLLSTTALVGIIGIAIVAASGATGARADDGTWTGAASGNWQTNGNWDGATFPGTADDDSATIDDGTAGTLANDPTLMSNETITDLNLSGTGNLTINAGVTLTTLGIFSQADGAIGGGGTVNVTNAFLQSGGTTGGTIDVNSAGFTQSGGAVVAAGTSVTSSGAQSLTGGTIAGTLDGAGAVTVSGGTTSLTGTIVNAASATINSGVLTVTGGGSLDTTGNQVAVTGGTLRTDGNGIADNEAVTVDGGNFLITGNETIASLAGAGGNVTLGAGATLTTGNAADATYAGMISGFGALTKQGTGTFTLTNSNLYTGSTTINAGVLNAQNAAALGAPDGTSTTVAAGAALELEGGIAIGNESLILSGTGVMNGGALRNVSGANVYNGGVSLAANARINSAAGTLTVNGGIVNGGNLLTVGGAGNTTVAGLISGGGGLTKDGTGTLSLTAVGPNTYSGATTISGGTLNANSSSSLGDASTTNTLIFNGGTLRATGAIVSPATRGVAVNAAGGSIDTNGNAVSFAGILSGAGALDKSGGGTLTFSGANTAVAGQSYTGAISVDTGVLQIAATEFGDLNGAIDASITANTNGRVNLGSGTVFANVVNNGGTISAGASPATVNVAGNYTVTSGTELFELGAPGTIGGGTNDLVNVGGNLTLANGGGSTLSLRNAADTGAAAAGLYRLYTYGGTGNFGGTNLGFDTVNGGANGTSLFLNGKTVNARVFGAGQLTQYFDGVDTTAANVGGQGGTGAWNAGTANWNDNAPGVAGNDINDIWRSQRGIFAGTAGTVTVNNSPRNFQDLVFQTDGYLVQGGTLGLAGAFGNANGQSSITVAGAATNATITSVIDGTTGLRKLGAGTLSLSGANTYDGITNLDAGTIRLGNDLALGDATFAGRTVAAAGTTLDYANGVTIGEQLLLNGNITFNQSGTASTQSGVISGAGGLTKTGAGTLALTAANTYLGATAVSGGVLQIGDGTAAGDTGRLGQIGTDFSNVSIAGATSTLQFNRTDSAPGYTYGGVISGNGVVQQIGSGQTNLTGNSSAFAGTTNVDGGTLQVNGRIGGTVNVGTNGTAGRLEGTGTVSTFGSTTTIGTDGTLAAGTSPGTLNVAGDLTLLAGSVSEFEFGTPTVIGGATNDLVNVGGNLTIAGTLNLGQPNSFTPGSTAAVVSGYYNLFDAGGGTTGAYTTINNGGANVTGTTQQIVTNPGNAPSEFNILLQNAGQNVQFWDGAKLNNQPGDTAPNGGTGTWNTGNTNWTTANGQINSDWDSQVGVFGTTGGTVTVAGTQNFQGLQFAANGYVVRTGTLNATGNTVAMGNPNASFLNVDGGATATISSDISGSATTIGIDKFGAGTVVLSGTNTYTGLTRISAGTLAVQGGAAIVNGNIAADGIAGSVVVGSGATFAVTNSEDIASLSGVAGSKATIAAGQTLTTGDAGNDAFAGVISGPGGLVKRGAGTFTLSGANTYGRYNGGTGPLFGTVVRGGTLTIAAGGSIASNVQNDATFINNGLVNASVLNNGAGTNNGAIGGRVTNNGGFRNPGTIGNGVVNNTGGNFINSQIVNGGLLNNVGGTYTQTGGTTNGVTTNDGVVNASGGAFGGPVVNRGTGAFNVRGGVTANSRFANNGTATLNVTGGDFTGITTLTNNSTAASGVTVATSRTLSANAVVNNNGATITNRGTLTSAAQIDNNLGATLTTTGTVNGGVINDGTVKAQGAFNGPIVNRGTGNFAATGNLTANGTFANNGSATLAVNGGAFRGITTLTNNATVNIAANSTLEAGVINNNAGGTITLGEGATLSGTSNTNNNAGTTNVGNGAAVIDNGAINNLGTGVFNFAGGARFDADVDNDGVGPITNAGRINLNGTNTQIVSVGPAGNNDLVNRGAGQLNVNAGRLDVAGALTNSSAGAAAGGAGGVDIAANGILNAQAVANAAGGEISNAGRLTSRTVVQNAGTLAVAGTGTLNGGLNNSGSASNAGVVNDGLTNSAGYTQTAGATNGGTVNTGTVNAAGGAFNGGVRNQAGRFNVTGAVGSNGAFSNTGGALLNVANGGAFTIGDGTGDRLANAGRVVVANGGTLDASADGLSNAASGNITNNGTTRGGVVANAGAITNNLNWTGAVSSNTGTIANNGTWTGNLTNTGGTIGNAGTIGGRVFNNAGTFTSTGTVRGGLANGDVANIEGMLNGDISNRGTFNLTGDTSGNGAFVNSGIYNGMGNSFAGLSSFNNNGTLFPANGSTIGAGTFINSGLIDLGGNDRVGDTFSIFGDLVGQGGQYNLDIDLGRNNTGNTQLSDLINVTGDLKGTGTVNFDQQNTTFTLQDNPITVFDVAGTNSANFTATGLPAKGNLIEYDFTKLGKDYVVISSVNPNVGGVAGNVILVQSLIGTVINRPSTPFVSSLVYDADPGSCHPGTWLRGTGGTGSADGSTTNQQGRSVNASVDLDYAGIQGGLDSNCLPIKELGVEFAFGLTGGYNKGTTSQDVLTANRRTSVTESDFDQWFAGGYIVGAKPIGEGVLAADLQFRYGGTDFSFDNRATTQDNLTLGLNDSELSSHRAEISGSVSYAYRLPNDFSFVPLAGVSYSKTFSNPLIFNNDNVISSLQIEDFKSLVGFGGATLAKNFIFEDQALAVRPFVTATVYNDFANDVGSTLTSSGAVQRLTSQNIGTFGEVSLGLDTIKLFDGGFGPVKQLNANLRGDAKFSDRVETYSLTGQLRFNY